MDIQSISTEKFKENDEIVYRMLQWMGSKTKGTPDKYREYKAKVIRDTGNKVVIGITFDGKLIKKNVNRKHIKKVK